MRSWCNRHPTQVAKLPSLPEMQPILRENTLSSSVLLPSDFDFQEKSGKCIQEQ